MVSKKFHLHSHNTPIYRLTMPTATAVPHITTEFHSIDDIGWYTSSYLLPLLALLPSFGKLYTYFDIKIGFICAIAIFEIGSIVCATAASSRIFIIGRVLCGIGASSINAGGMTIIGLVIPLSRISVFLGGLTSVNAIAALAGPPLGGLFTDTPRLTWRFCFWINLREPNPL